MASTRQLIVKTAVRDFRNRGPAGVSLRAVARSVGITPMAVYHYFADKDALIDAIVAAGFDLWDSYLVEAAAAPTALRRVRAGLTAYRQFALAEPRFFELMMLTPRRGIPLAPASLANTPSTAFNTIMASAAELMAVSDRALATEMVLTLWATAHGLIALHFTGRFGGDDAVFEKSYDAVLERVLSALVPRRDDQ